MAEQHRATNLQWACIKAQTCGESDVVAYSTIHELLCRIEALEAPQSGSIDLSHLSDAERGKTLKMLANPGTFEVLEVAQPAKPNHPEIPDGSLVERVACAITGDSDGPINWKPEARAAIREVAAWLREHFPHSAGGWAMRLEQEAER